MTQYLKIPYEILVKPVIPGPAQATPSPLVQQSFEVQIYNDNSLDAQVSFNFYGSPPFAGQRYLRDVDVRFFADVIGPDGARTSLTAQVLDDNGFSYTIPQLSVCLFSIGYTVSSLPGGSADATPDVGCASRGQLEITGGLGILRCFATIRQVVAVYQDSRDPIALSASACAVPVTVD